MEEEIQEVVVIVEEEDGSLDIEFLSEEERAQARELAHQLEVVIKDAIDRGREAYWDLAAALYEFNERAGWALLAYETQGDWLAQPEIGMSSRTYFRMVRLYRETVILRELPAERVKELDPSKVEIVLPAVASGEKTIDEALGDAESVGQRDLREMYIGPQGAPRRRREGKADATGRTATGESARDNGQPDPAYLKPALGFDSWATLGGRKDKARRDWGKLKAAHPVFLAIALIEAYLEDAEGPGGEAIEKPDVRAAWGELAVALDVDLA
jgi:hypothetical protein